MSGVPTQDLSGASTQDLSGAGITSEISAQHLPEQGQGQEQEQSMDAVIRDLSGVPIGLRWRQ